MATNMKRVMLSITPELEQGLNEVKKESFYDKPFSEVYRYVFSLGLEAAKKKENQSKKSCGVNA